MVNYHLGSAFVQSSFLGAGFAAGADAPPDPPPFTVLLFSTFKLMMGAGAATAATGASSPHIKFLPTTPATAVTIMVTNPMMAFFNPLPLDSSDMCSPC